MPETVVLCGGAPPPYRRARMVRLSTDGAEANVELRSEDIGRRMLASLPATLADLLDVATYIYCADQLVSRGGSTGRQLGADWRRELRFVIPVREPDRWSSPEVTQRLERLLAFMSDDNTRFEFVRARDGPTGSGYFDFGSRSTRSRCFLAASIPYLVRSIDFPKAPLGSSSSAINRQPR